MDQQPETQVEKATYETPALKRLGSLRDLTLGVNGVPQADVLFVGSL